MKQVTRKAFLAIIAFTVLILAAILFEASTTYGISVKKPYDGHIESLSEEAPDQQVYQKDLAFVWEEIKKNYVNLDYKEKKFGFSWDELYKGYEAKLDQTQNEKEFYSLCLEFLSNLRDGHLSLQYSNHEVAGNIRNYSGDFLQAVDIRIIEDKPVIVRTKLSGNLVGSEVLSINGVDFNEILDTMIRYWYRGGTDASARTRLLLSNYYYNYFSYLYDTYPEQLVFQIRDRNGSVSEFSIDTTKPFVSANGDSSLGSRTTGGGILFGFDYNDEVFPSCRLLRDNIGYIRIPTFDGNARKIVKEFDQGVKQLKSTGVKGVILDIRYNPGGNQSFRDILGYLTTQRILLNQYRFRDSERFRELYFLRPLYENLRSPSNRNQLESGYTKWWSWEVRPAGEHFLTTVPVAVLVNESIFSSADSFAQVCLEYNLAKVTGNMVPLSGNGLPTPISLPSKKYYLSYGFMESRGLDYSYTENMVKEPDIKAMQTLGDYYEGIDTQLERASEFILSGK